jgi:EAL domain-containing protein (putative c-di-GMP-specific phosphodiesterase class I)
MTDGEASRTIPASPASEPAVPVAPAARAFKNPNKTNCGVCRNATELFAFTMAFQPIVDVEHRRIEAYEALVRGPDGESAGSILAQVDQSNMYAFDQACRVKAIELASRLGLRTRLNVNFLPNAVYEPRACIRATLETAARTGFDTSMLTFEIVETEYLAEPQHLSNIVAEYRRMGFQIALDDFGTGYSGLARLESLHPDIVKIDRALIANCDNDQRRLDIIGCMIMLGDRLGTKMVAEGVETAGEAAALQKIGARYQQGFFYARPAVECLVGEASIFTC